MRKSISVCGIAALFSIGLLIGGFSPANARSSVWTGRVVHVSADNIKVHNFPGDKTLSFLLAAPFKRVYSVDGQTKYRFSDIKSGMIVKVFYDQKLFGARHADKIFVLNADGYPLHAVR